jgi:hypothetical protein
MKRGKGRWEEEDSYSLISINKCRINKENRRKMKNK